MTEAQIREVLLEYKINLEHQGVQPIDFDHDAMYPTRDNALGHCLGMITQMLKFLEEGKMDKLNRWLGFIQGVLWDRSVYPLTQLKDHNRPQE